MLPLDSFAVNAVPLHVPDTAVPNRTEPMGPRRCGGHVLRNLTTEARAVRQADPRPPYPGQQAPERCLRPRDLAAELHTPDDAPDPTSRFQGNQNDRLPLEPHAEA
jgi:hypothetical protein